MEKFPESIIAQWSYAKFNCENDTAQNILLKQKEQINGTPWNPVSHIYNFKLMYMIYFYH